MGVVSHSYARLGGAGMDVVVCKHSGKSHEWLVACQEMLEHFPIAR